MRVMSLDTMKSCLLPYIAVGWTGYVPSTCENTQLHIPEKYAPYMWGFSNKFLKRMEDVNARVISLQVMVVGQKALIKNKTWNNFLKITQEAYGLIVLIK